MLYGIVHGIYENKAKPAIERVWGLYQRDCVHFSLSNGEPFVSTGIVKSTEESAFIAGENLVCYSIYHNIRLFQNMKTGGVHLIYEGLSLTLYGPKRLDKTTKSGFRIGNKIAEENMKMIPIPDRGEIEKYTKYAGEFAKIMGVSSVPLRIGDKTIHNVPAIEELDMMGVLLQNAVSQITKGVRGIHQ